MMKNFVEPIRDKSRIEDIEFYLKNTNIRNWILFVFGINTGLRISDILALNICDVRNKTHVSIKEKKTNKYKKFPINKRLQLLLNNYTDNKNLNEPLFLSKKKYRLDRSQVYRIINDACKAVGISENVGTHTMRKTFGYHHYKKFKDVAMLQTIFNHSSPQITLKYIGISQDEIDDSYNNFEL